MNAQNQKLDPVAAVCVVIGSILGSGVFIAPSILADFSPSTTITLGFWIFGGLICAIGAGIYGSLALAYPCGGGQYVFLRETLGPGFARFYGWASVTVICPTMLASTCLFLAEQFRPFFPMSDIAIKVFAITTIVLFTWINTHGIHIAGSLQKNMVILQVTLFLAVLALSAYLLPGDHISSGHVMPSFDGLDVSKGMLALAVVLWSYEGFNAATFITNEIEDGERNVRRVALWGCFIVMLLYIVFVYTVLQNVPASELKNHPNAAAVLMSLAFGQYGGALVLALTALGIATTLHASVMIGPRVTAATASDGAMPESLCLRHPKYLSPNRALWLQCFAVIAYTLVGHFSALVTAFIVLNWLFYGVTILGFVLMRIRDRRVGRDNGWFGPEMLGSAIFIAMVALLVGLQFKENPKLAWAGVAVFIVGTMGSELVIRFFGKIRYGFQRVLATARMFLT